MAVASSEESASATARAPLAQGGGWLYLLVIAAIMLGIAVGYLRPELGVALRPMGDLFVKLVKLVVPPVIFLTIVTGIAGMDSLGTLGKVTLKALLYFFAVSTLALVVGMAAANLLHPGTGMNIDPATLRTGSVSEYITKAHAFTIPGFLASLVPDSIMGAFVDGNILQVLLIAILFGIGFSLAGERARPVVQILESASSGVFQMVQVLMQLAPLGAFGAMAYTVGKFGLGAIINLAGLVAAFYVTSAIFVLVVLGGILALCGFSILGLLNYLKNELLLVLGTSSSESALSSLMEKMEAAGCGRTVVGLVVPAGYSFNLDGTNIYMSLAALFIAQATNIHLSLGAQILLLGVAMVSSKGAAGVTGAGFITLAATLSVVPTVPLAGLALVLGVDRFMSQCRAVTNCIGNAVAAIVISRWQRQLDVPRMRRTLAGT